MLQHVAFFIMAIALFAMSAFTVEQAVDEETATLSGIVVDVDSDEPIPNATLVLVGTDYSAETGTDGTFEFGEISAGEYELAVEADGYPEKVRNIVLEAGHNEIELELQAGY